MIRKHWILAVLLPLFGSWLIDRISKELASGLTEYKFYGPFGLVLHHNHGAVLGLFSELPAILRIVSLSTGGAFLIFSFFIIQYLLPTKSLTLRTGMSFLMGGIIGNVTDRILTGYVIDFLIIGNLDRSTPAFNFADAIQWVGYFMIVFAMVKEGKNLWPENNLRKSYWVNPKFQLAYCFKLIGLGLGFAIIAATYSYTYFKVTIIELIGHQEVVENKFLFPFLITFLVVTLSFMTILFLVGLILSHRSAGPLYAFEKFLEDLTTGNVRDLKLRAGDEFVHLEHLAKKLAARTDIWSQFAKDFQTDENQTKLDLESESTQDPSDKTPKSA